MKKGQMSMEIGVLLLVAIVCSAIGGYYFSSNVAESGNSTGDSANTVNSVLRSTSENSLANLETTFINIKSESALQNIKYYTYLEDNIISIPISSTESYVYIQIDENYADYNNGSQVFSYYNQMDSQDNLDIHVTFGEYEFIDSTLHLNGDIGIGTQYQLNNNEQAICKIKYVGSCGSYNKPRVRCAPFSKPFDVIIFADYNKVYWNGFTDVTSHAYKWIYVESIINSTNGLNYNICDNTTTYYSNSLSSTIPSYLNLGTGDGNSKYGAELYIDYILARQYLENPPTISDVELIEENLIKITFNSNGSTYENYPIDINMDLLSGLEIFKNASLKIYSE